MDGPSIKKAKELFDKLEKLDTMYEDERDKIRQGLKELGTNYDITLR